MVHESGMIHSMCLQVMISEIGLLMVQIGADPPVGTGKSGEKSLEDRAMPPGQDPGQLGQAPPTVHGQGAR